MRKIAVILFLSSLFVIYSMAESSLEYINANIASSVDSNITNLDINESISQEENLSSVETPNTRTLRVGSSEFPRKSLLEVEAEARVIIAEEVAKVEIVKANALAVIARAVASVEIAKIREEQEKESQSDLF